MPALYGFKTLRIEQLVVEMFSEFEIFPALKPFNIHVDL